MILTPLLLHKDVAFSNLRNDGFNWPESRACGGFVGNEWHVVTLPVANQRPQLFHANENVNPEWSWTIANDSPRHPKLVDEEKCVTNF